MRAPLAPPDDIEAVPLTGLTWRGAGSLDLAGAHGNYVREEGTYREGNTLHKQGSGRFTMSGPGIHGTVEGRCGSHSSESSFGPLTVTKDRILYRCSFTRDGRPIDARLVLEEPEPAKSFGFRLTTPREGLLFYFGRRMDLKSVHEYMDAKGAKVKGKANVPTGYAFVVDGREIGGVSVTFPHQVYLPRDPDYREAALVASLSLALFSEPEDMSEEPSTDYGQ